MEIELLLIKLMLITSICVFIDTNLDSIINIANSIADNMIFFILDIKKSPFFIVHAIKKEEITFSSSLLFST